MCVNIVIRTNQCTRKLSLKTNPNVTSTQNEKTYKRGMELCRVCKKVNGSLVCPCGRFLYCSPDCLSKSGHLYTCDYQRLDFGHMVSIMHSFMPIFEAVKEDKELYGASKELLLLMRKKLDSMNIGSADSALSKDL